MYWFPLPSSLPVCNALFFLIAISKPRPPVRLPARSWLEYAEVLARPELTIRKGLRLQLLQLIKNHGHTVSPNRRLEVTVDPADNMFLECADAARADYLVTVNQKHFPKFWKNKKVVTSRELGSRAAPHLGE